MAEFLADKPDSGNTLEASDRPHPILLPSTMKYVSCTDLFRQSSPAWYQVWIWRLPWSDLETVERGSIIGSHAYSDVFLPGCIPLFGMENQT